VTTSAHRRPRDSTDTRARILDAVGRLLARGAIADVGVNAVAREAGVDKVLIYRYFGGLPELLAAFAERTEFFPDVDEIVGPPAGDAGRRTPLQWGLTTLRNLVRGLRARPLTLAIMRSELATSNELTRSLGRARERRGLEILRRAPHIDDAPPHTDVAAIAGVLSAGVIYLLLRSHGTPAWNGVPLQTEEGWARIERAVEIILRAVLEAGRTSGTRPSRRGSRRR
jgi:AcrR family transcriptional regulator